MDIPDTVDVSDIDIADELGNSYFEYALSVVVSRSVPDIRDGLKPVHRRVIYAMAQAGLKSSNPYRKSASAVGETMKTYHPHGDRPIYDTLVRMAQDWSMRVPLIDGHGNFGSLDAGPAAPRYTEARLAPAAEALLAGVAESTVDMRPNFDASTTEPWVLPAAFPNLLVNGTQGIAVGIATAIPPHNLGEAIAACRAWIADPKLGVAGLRKHIPGPDFPTGGIAYGGAEFDELYSTGRGKFTLRATGTVEQLTPRTRGIVFTELPYGVGPEKVIAEVKDRVNAGRLDGVTDIVDLSDRHGGLRLVVETHPGADPERVLAMLYKLTSLEVTFPGNMIALSGGRPVTCTLEGLVAGYVEHRVEVVRRRSEHRLAKATERAHIVDGLLIALDALDQVIAIIRSSKDTAKARAALRKEFKFSEQQADHILEMPLRRLTALEVTKLKSERAELTRTIRDLTKIVKSRKVQLQVVDSELAEVSEQFATPRRTRLLAKAPAGPAPLPAAKAAAPAASGSAVAATVAADVVATTVAVAGDKVWRVPQSSRKALLPATATVATTSDAQVAVVTSAGRAIMVPVIELAADGTQVPLSAYLDIAKSERAVGVFPADHELTVGLFTANGTVKRVAAPLLPSPAAIARAGREGFEVITLADGDTLVAAFPTGDDGYIVAVTSDAQLLRFPVSAVRPQGRPAGGMAGIRLSAGARVIAAAAETEGAVVVAVTDSGSVKMSTLADYPAKGRGTAGVRCVTFRAADNAVAAAWVGSGAWTFTVKGKPVSVDVPVSKRDASASPVDTPVDGAAMLAVAPVD